MIAKLLSIALLVNGDDARIFHRYSFRSSNFTFFISKTVFFKLYYVVHVCACAWVSECKCAIATYTTRSLFYIYIFFIVVACVSSLAGHQSRTVQTTFTKHLNCNLIFILFFYVRVSCHNRIEIYIRFLFHSRFFVAVVVVVFFYYYFLIELFSFYFSSLRRLLQFKQPSLSLFTFCWYLIWMCMIIRFNKYRWLPFFFPSSFLFLFLVYRFVISSLGAHNSTKNSQKNKGSRSWKTIFLLFLFIWMNFLLEAAKDLAILMRKIRCSRNRYVDRRWYWIACFSVWFEFYTLFVTNEVETNK